MGQLPSLLPGASMAPPSFPGLPVLAGAGIIPGVRPPAFMPGIVPGLGAAAPKKPVFQPAPLRLDEEGREIDEQGNVVARTVQAVTTLKVRQCCRVLLFR